MVSLVIPNQCGKRILGEPQKGSFRALDAFFPRPSGKQAYTISLQASSG